MAPDIHQHFAVRIDTNEDTVAPCALIIVSRDDTGIVEYDDFEVTYHTAGVGLMGLFPGSVLWLRRRR